MKHNCEKCKKSIKEVGQLGRVMNYGHHEMWCKKCRWEVGITSFRNRGFIDENWKSMEREKKVIGDLVVYI